MKRRLWLRVMLIIVIALASGAGALYFQEVRLGKTIQEKNDKIVVLEEEIAALVSVPKASAVVFNKDMNAGQTITEEDLMTIGIEEPIAPEDIVTDKENIVGNMLKVNVGMYHYATENVFYSPEELDDDVREQEFAYLTIPSKLAQGDYVDLRIKFPTGQDYTVLSKKLVADFVREYSNENVITKETVWLLLNEKEIIRIGSATVDAYINGAKMYLIEYVDGSVQEAADITYPENFPVLEMISQYPDIIDQATIDLELDRRQELEDTLGEMFTNDKVNFTVPSLQVPQMPMTNEDNEMPSQPGANANPVGSNEPVVQTVEPPTNENSTTVNSNQIQEDTDEDTEVDAFN